jgi:glycosyltransferase involved in cell wall biosynthesis
MDILVTSLPDLKKIHPQRCHHLLQYLSSRHHISVLGTNAWWLNENIDEFTQKSLENVEYRYLFDEPLHPVLQELYAKRVCRKLSREIDFTSFDAHLNFHSLIAGPAVASKVNGPTIFDLCDDIVDWMSKSPLIPGILKPAANLAGQFLLKRNIRISDKITYSANILKERFHIPPQRAVQISNGVDTTLFHPNNRIKKAELGIPKDAYIAGFVGFLGDWIDLEPAMRMVKKCYPRIFLLIIGSGTRMELFKTLAKDLGIEHLVVFLGNVPYLNVPDYISCMDVCLLPFNSSPVAQSALPLKLFEYMACEKPVISSPIPPVMDAVGNRIIYAANTDDLIDIVARFIDDKSEFLDLGLQGRAFVAQNYSWETIVKKFERVFLDCVAERGGI